MVTSVPPPGWQQPWCTIAIAALERSGSTLLSEYMRLTDVLGRPNEFFSRWVMPAAYPNVPESMTSWAQLAYQHGRTENGVLSVKLFPEHFQQFQKELRFSEWFGTPRWVWLRRNDLVGQAISFVMAQQTRAYQAMKAPIAEAQYDGVAIAHTLQLVAARDAMWAAYFARTRIEPLRLIYEDIESDALGTVRKIAEHAGVRLNVPPLRAQPSLQKQRGKMTEEWRERFFLEFGRPDEISIETVVPPARMAQAPPKRSATAPFAKWLTSISRRKNSRT